MIKKVYWKSGSSDQSQMKIWRYWLCEQWKEPDGLQQAWIHPPKITIRILNSTENWIYSLAKKALNHFNLTSYTGEFSLKNGQRTIAWKPRVNPCFQRNYLKCIQITSMWDKTQLASKII